MILGLFCATLCAAAPWHVAIEPDGAMMMNGARVGTYVDDTTPDQAGVVAQDVAEGQFVVAGVTMPESFPGALSAIEFYPFYNARRVAAPMPDWPAYIVQGSGSWNGDTPGATAAQRHREWVDAVSRHPVMVLTYNGPLIGSPPWWEPWSK